MCVWCACVCVVCVCGACVRVCACMREGGVGMGRGVEGRGVVGLAAICDDFGPPQSDFPCFTQAAFPANCCHSGVSRRNALQRGMCYCFVMFLRGLKSPKPPRPHPDFHVN